MTSKTKELLATRAGKWVSDYIDDMYRKRKKELRASGRLDELMQEANSIEKSIVRDAEQAFFDNNPHFLEMLREFNWIKSSTQEVVNHEISLLVDTEMRDEVDVFDLF
jgi:hypothetical protein